MKIRRVVFVLCPLFLHVLLAQPAFDANEENPYMVGIAIAKQYGPEQAQKYFQACHRETGELMCFYGLAYTWNMMGDHQQSLDLVTFLLADEPVPDNLAGYWWMLKGENQLNLLQLQEAQESFRTSLEYFQKMNHERNMYRALLQLGNCQLKAGNLEEADRLIRDAAFLGRKIQENRGHLYILRSISAYCRGKYHAAENFAKLASAEFQDYNQVSMIVDCKAYISLFQKESGNLEAANKSLQEARELTQVYEIKEPDWTKLVRAYVQKCEDPAFSEATLQPYKKAKRNYFIDLFLQKIEKTRCP